MSHSQSLFQILLINSHDRFKNLYDDNATRFLDRSDSHCGSGDDA
jgi:hypothetical protein